MMNTDEYIYRVKRTDKRTAWRLFKYFRLHSELLQCEENKIIYENARKASVYYQRIGDATSFSDIGDMLDFLADLENEHDDGSYVPTPTDLDFYLHYDQHQNRLLSLILLSEWNDSPKNS